MELDGKVVWIVGASSGIGEATAYAMARCGARLVLSARRRAELERVRDRCRQCGAEAGILVLDLCNETGVASAPELAREHFGCLDILVLCAGVSQRSRIADTELAVYRRLMEINYFGAVGLALATLPVFRAQAGGHFVVVSSLVGKFGTPMRSGYAASKHALHGFFDSLRAEHRQDGIAVTMACPGYVQTQISMHSLTGKGTPYGRVDEAIEQGLPVERCAQSIVSGIRRKKEEFLIGGPERYAVYVARFWPRLFSRLVSRAEIR